MAKPYQPNWSGRWPMLPPEFEMHEDPAHMLVHIIYKTVRRSLSYEEAAMMRKDESFMHQVLHTMVKYYHAQQEPPMAWNKGAIKYNDLPKEVEKAAAPDTAVNWDF